MDAHLDLRPCPDGRGNSGSPFFQALEHPTHPLTGSGYVCLGAQPHSVSRRQWGYACEHGCTVRWRDDPSLLEQQFQDEVERLAEAGLNCYLTIDADAVQTADVPGVSAPNVAGLPGREIIACARRAGQSSQITSLDLVEINPRHDRDGQACRWAALVLWTFLTALGERAQ
jgi:formiminoglutamase